VATAVTAFLRGRDGDVLDVKEQGWFGKTDAELFTHAQQDGRVILTYDVDFGALRKLRQRHPGIVIVRLRHLHPNRVIASLDHFLKKYAAEDLTNGLAVLEETRVRFRRRREVDRSPKGAGGSRG